MINVSTGEYIWQLENDWLATYFDHPHLIKEDETDVCQRNTHRQAQHVDVMNINCLVGDLWGKFAFVIC